MEKARFHIQLDELAKDPKNRCKKFSIMNGDQTAIDYHVLEFEDSESMLAFKLRYGHLL
jgi:hypothetical protein